jgi:transcription elongation factor GreA-like protein
LIYGNNETFRFNEENIKEIYSSIRNMAEEQKFIEVIEKALCFWGKVYSNRLISS